MTAIELEERLLRFTREKLAEREVADSITVDTRLFEDRVIDSLKILELIAYLQSTLGRKIPDAQIVLANFRSIATIARVFTEGAPATVTRTRRRAVPRPSNGNSNGELELTPNGGLILRGAASGLFDYFDNTIRGWALELGAIEQAFPTDIPLATLGRAGFTTAFPQKLVWTGEQGGESVGPPAVCYHHYPCISDSTLDGRGSIVTAVGRCYRNEFDPNSAHPAERLAAFTMREIIAVGDAGVVENLRNDLMNRVSAWLKELSLEGHIEIASDPFFTSEARGRMLMQQLLPLKYELRLRVGADGRSVAAASFNNHERHFGKAFSILLPSGEAAHSGCVAFGWERWVIAFVNQHGAEEESWPEIVRSRNVAANV